MADTGSFAAFIASKKDAKKASADKKKAGVKAAAKSKMSKSEKTGARSDTLGP